MTFRVNGSRTANLDDVLAIAEERLSVCLSVLQRLVTGNA